jgi:hypothetical protein
MEINVITADKFTKEEWESIEKPLTVYERQRNQILVELAEKAYTNNTDNLDIEIESGLTIIGDYNYVWIRNEVSKYIKLNKIDKEEMEINSKNKKINIILENNKKSLEGKLETLKQIIGDVKITEKKVDDLMINFNYLEFRIIILMKIIECYTENELNKDEIIIASKKILYNIKKMSREPEKHFTKIFNIENIEIKVSEQMIRDLEYKLERIQRKHNIKLYEIANERPQLMFNTRYDNIVSSIRLRPYESQIRIMEIIRENMERGFLVMYKALPGLGKTSMVLGIVKYLQKMNNGYKLLFCCSDLLDTVRRQVLIIMYNFGIKFGIGVGDSVYNKDIKKYEDKYRIINSFNCKKDEYREMIVADYLTTSMILEENREKYILFFDEPTIQTDSKNNRETLERLSKILHLMPKHTILSSATLPDKKEMVEICKKYEERQGGRIEEVISNKTLLGCVIKDYNNNIITPHSKCRTREELGILIEKIRRNPLLGKFYTLPFLMNLNKFMKKYKKDINLEEIESFDQESVLENIMILLERVVEIGDEEYEEFRKIDIRDINDVNINKEMVDKNYERVVYDRIITQHAYKYIGCCLIATDSPENFSKRYLFDIVDKLKERVKITSIMDIKNRYEKEKETYNKMVESIEKQCKTDEMKDREYKKIEKYIPRYEFPDVLEINSIEHIKTFSKYVRSYSVDMIKKNIRHEEININCNIHDNVEFMLHIGIGLYYHGMHSNYKTKVLEMLSNNQLAYIIADESFCYGANYGINNVIITDELGDKHSINTILQLIGRTSRVGKSWSGKVYLDDRTAERMKEYFMTQDNKSVEGENISESFMEYYEKQERIKQEEIKKKQEEEERIRRELEHKKKMEEYTKKPEKIEKVEKIKNKYDNKPREYKPREYKPREYKPREYKPREERPRDDREYKPREERPREERPREEKERINAEEWKGIREKEEVREVREIRFGYKREMLKMEENKIKVDDWKDVRRK